MNRRLGVLLAFVIWLGYLGIAQAQDWGVYGVFGSNQYVTITNSMRNSAYGTCFRGIGLTSCRPNLVDDDIALSYERDSYKDLASLYGNFYCVDCCGDPPDYIDTWDLSCDNTVRTQGIIQNFNNMELRMARKKTLTDNELTICQFNRTNPDTTFLHGYTVTLTVEQYDAQFSFWRGVSKCVIDVDQRNESLPAGATFRETIILKHVPIDTFSPTDPVKMSIIIGGGVIGLYIVLYFLRRKRCEYCQGKLVISPRLCYKCVLVGAQPPDPVLLKALEDRGIAMQGKPPERFGFVQVWCVGCCQRIIRCFTCQCWCACCYKSCRFLTCNGFCGRCCQEKPDDKIYAEAEFADLVTEAQLSMESMERGDDAVESFDPQSNGAQPETETGGNKKKPRSKRQSRQERLAAEAKELERLEKRQENNPNILKYPAKTIYKAVKHPSVV